MSKIEYVPPSSEIIDEFAKKVCDALGETDPEIRYGLADFLKVSSTILAKQMTREQSNEKGNEQS